MKTTLLELKLTFILIGNLDFLRRRFENHIDSLLTFSLQFPQNQLFMHRASYISSFSEESLMLIVFELPLPHGRWIPLSLTTAWRADLTGLQRRDFP